VKTAKILRIEAQIYVGTVYNIELETNDLRHDDLFWICNGIAVHNCLPKDLNALKKVADKLGVDTKVLDAVWEKNLEVRPEEDRDWEKMQGRAVSKRDKR
jgi:hypothetical protein